MVNVRRNSRPTFTCAHVFCRVDYSKIRKTILEIGILKYLSYAKKGKKLVMSFSLEVRRGVENEAATMPGNVHSYIAPLLSKSY